MNDRWLSKERVGTFDFSGIMDYHMVHSNCYSKGEYSFEDKCSEDDFNCPQKNKYLLKKKMNEEFGNSDENK